MIFIQVLALLFRDLLRDDFHTHLALVQVHVPVLVKGATAAPDVSQWRNQHAARQQELDARAGRSTEVALFGDDTAKLLPVTSDEMSDSGNFDGVLRVGHVAARGGDDHGSHTGVLYRVDGVWRRPQLR